MTAGSGTCTLTATQDGDLSHAASSVTRQVEATNATLPLSLTVSSPLTYMQSEALTTSGGSQSTATVQRQWPVQCKRQHTESEQRHRFLRGDGKEGR